MLCPRDFSVLINDPQLSEVTSGVAYLHELKIVHGDLKGASTMLLMCGHPAYERNRQMSSSITQASPVWLISVS